MREQLFSFHMWWLNLWTSVHLGSSDMKSLYEERKELREKVRTDTSALVLSV